MNDTTGNIAKAVGTPPVSISLFTIDDRRTLQEDSSGDLLERALNDANHSLQRRMLLKCNKYQIRQYISEEIADPKTNVIILTGGTGLNTSDITLEAITPLFDKPIEGFGEIFRQLSFRTIGSASIQSRACAGIANQTLIFALPGSPKACKLAWSSLISPQLDNQTKPCNFIPYLIESNEYCNTRKD